MKTQNVVVDIGNLKASDIFFVQGEQGREITFKVINSLLEDFVNLAGYTATIHILKSDGNFTIDSMKIDASKSECYYTLTENDCACGGRGFYDLSFSKNDELIYTAHGDFVGDFRSVNDDSVNSVSSAYGVTFPEGFQQKLIAGDKITISDDNVISAEGEVYTAGDNINISDNNVISATDTTYSAGDNINISDNNVISAIIGGDTIVNNVPLKNYDCDYGSKNTLISHFFENGQPNEKWTFVSSGYWLCSDLVNLDCKCIVNSYVINIDSNNNYSMVNTSVTYIGAGQFALNFPTSTNTYIVIEFIEMGD